MAPYKPRAAGSSHSVTAGFIESCGGDRAVSDFLGNSRYTVIGWSDPDKSTGIPFSTACLLSEAFARPELAEHIAARLGGFFISGTPLDGAGWASLTRDLSLSAGETVAKIVNALCPSSDGGVAVTAREARDLLPQIDAMQRMLGHLRVQALQVAREG